MTPSLDEFVWAAGRWWPLLGLVVVAAGGYVWAEFKRARAREALGRPELMTRLLASVHHANRFAAAACSVLAVGAIIIGLMRPQYGGSAQVIPASGLDVVLVVDYSKSMLATDIYPSRSERLEAELSRFLDDADRRGDRVGLVVFAGRPRGFPITRDTRMLKLYLDRASPKTENPGGTAIGRALNLAVSFLVDARRASESDPGDDEGSEVDVPPAEGEQVIVLLTDGEDTETRPLEVAEKAATLGIRIYTVGIGSKSGEPVQKFDDQGEPDGFVTDEDGNYVMTRLDEALLKSVASATDGEYVAVDMKSFGLDEVRSKLESLSRAERQDTIEIHRDEGFKFAIVPALLLLCLGLALPERRRLA